jgi:3D (Asp-Asp-Asp) domain-containing protein
LRVLIIFWIWVILASLLFSAERSQDDQTPADNPGSLRISKNSPQSYLFHVKPDKLALALSAPVASVEPTRGSSVPTEHIAATRASRSTRRAPAPAMGIGPSGARRVASTAYCLKGHMADGQVVHSSAVAMNGVPLGSRFQVLETGVIYTVEDRIGSGSQFDIWMSSCAAAVQYGRRNITLVPA